jgi:hypothetical protein
MDMQKFFEYFVERLLCVWLPLYSLHRIAKDFIEDYEAKHEANQ